MEKLSVNIKLAPLTSSDYVGLLPILSDPRVVVPSGLQLPNGGAALRWAIQALLSNHHCFGIKLTPESLVGMIVCDPLVDQTYQLCPHRFELAYLLSFDCWGHHIMTNAIQIFEDVVNPNDKQLVLVAKVRPTNLASLKVLANTGFKRVSSTDSQIIEWHLRRDHPKTVAGQPTLRV